MITLLLSHLMCENILSFDTANLHIGSFRVSCQTRLLIRFPALSPPILLMSSILQPARHPAMMPIASSIQFLGQRPFGSDRKSETCGRRTRTHRHASVLPLVHHPTSFWLNVVSNLSRQQQLVNPPRSFTVLPATSGKQTTPPTASIRMSRRAPNLLEISQRLMT